LLSVDYYIMNGNGHKRKSATPIAAAAAAADTSSFHPPPSFRLADDVAAESSRFELWTVRLPQAVDSDDINGLELTLADPSSQIFESNGSKYTFQWGHPVENESFRLLLPKSKEEKKKDKGSDSDSDDDDSDDDDEQYYLYPTHIPFTKHVNVVAAVPLLAETEIAPRVENAPTALVPIRRAYQHVPPKTGLKRRWMPLGSALTKNESETAGAGAVAVPSIAERKKVKTLPKTKSPTRTQAPTSPAVKARSPSPPVTTNLKEEHIKDEHIKEEHIKEEQSETRAEKSARKEAKKAKKESKKAKKESKKVKEER
jgi:hypothetical protein